MCSAQDEFTLNDEGIACTHELHLERRFYNKGER